MGCRLLIDEALRSYWRHIKFCRTSLEEWSARRTYLYQTTHNLARDRHYCPWQDSNSQSQQASVCRPTP